jgi:lipopolysaccharide/colanic/teichoic acid biosynthesis glycosyltransferase
MRHIAGSGLLYRAGRTNRALKRLLDLEVAAILLVLCAPFIVLLAIAIKIDSRGPVLFRCRRVGLSGREFSMLKFRKMWDGAGGPPLTTAVDDRLTRLGRFLAASKLDELPQLWNVIKGDMSLVGPRPEDPAFVRLAQDEYDEILSVRPGITGLSQLAFAREGEILDGDDRIAHYVAAIFPQKRALDAFYASCRSIRMDLAILFWTVRAVVTRCDVAVDRHTAKLSLRRRQPAPALAMEESTVASQ